MNNLSCEIIQDLLPLYCDGVCSEESKKTVLSHIKTCPTCREALRVMALPVDASENSQELKAAGAASRVWKRHKRKAFRTGVILAAVLVAMAVAVFFLCHYIQTCAADDMTGLEAMLESCSETAPIRMHSVAQKGDYLAASGCDGDGLWHLGVYTRDKVFPDRWKICGSLNKVKPGYLANWNYQTAQGDTILVCFGAELSRDICGYTFTNSGVTYTCTVEECAVLDFFYIPDAYDAKTHLEPIYQP